MQLAFVCQLANWSGPLDGDPLIAYCVLMFKKDSDLFTSALQSLPQFIMETDADWGMVYDFMEAQCGELRDEYWEEVSEVYKEFMNDSRY